MSIKTSTEILQAAISIYNSKASDLNKFKLDDKERKMFTDVIEAYQLQFFTTLSYWEMKKLAEDLIFVMNDRLSMEGRSYCGVIMEHFYKLLKIPLPVMQLSEITDEDLRNVSIMCNCSDWKLDLIKAFLLELEGDMPLKVYQYLKPKYKIPNY
jgi:hypothetical protein